MKIKNQPIENLRKEGLSFYGHPIKYSLKDYDQILDKIKNRAQKIKEILSIYTFGKVNVPGISDLDLIFVLKENSRLPPFFKKNYLGKDSKYLIFHPFFIITENSMKNIRYIYPNSDFIKIYGKKIDIYKPSESEIKKIKTHLTIDIILRHFPVDYLYILLSRRVDMRMALVRLNALSHSFEIFKDISGKEKPSWKNFSKKVDHLRKNWFSTSKALREDKILDLLKEAVYISTDFVKEFNIFLSKNKSNLVYTKKQDIIFKGNKHRISFIRNWDKEKAISQMISHFLKYKNFYSIIPIIFLKQLCCYSSAKGKLSRYIRKRLNIKCFQGNMCPVMKKRIQNLNEQVEYANKLRHSHYPCFFPLGYKTEKGFKNKLILLFVAVTSSSVFRRILFYFSL